MKLFRRTLLTLALLAIAFALVVGVGPSPSPAATPPPPTSTPSLSPRHSRQARRHAPHPSSAPASSNIREYRAGGGGGLIMTGGPGHSQFVEAHVMAQFAESPGRGRRRPGRRRPRPEHHQEHLLLRADHAYAQMVPPPRLSAPAYHLPRTALILATFNRRQPARAAPGEPTPAAHPNTPSSASPWSTTAKPTAGPLYTSRLNPNSRFPPHATKQLSLFSNHLPRFPTRNCDTTAYTQVRRSLCPEARQSARLLHLTKKRKFFVDCEEKRH